MLDLISNHVINFILFWGIWLLIPLLVDVVTMVIYLMSLLVHNEDKEIDNFNLDHYPYVTIVVPVFNSEGTLTMCLESLVGQSYPASSIHVICVDNGSQDKSFELFQKFQVQHQEMTLMWVSIERPSKSIALNVGMYSGQGTYLINLDSDTWLDRDAILNVVKVFEKDSTLMAATGSIRVDKSFVQQPSFMDIINYCEVVEYLIAFDIGRRYHSMRNTMFTLSGAFSAFRRETILQSFLYQERTVSEDTDLTFNLRNSLKEKNGRIGCISKAIAYVEPIESLARLYSQRLRWQRGEMEVVAAYYTEVPSVIKAMFNLIGRTLLTDHTLALTQMSWTFLLPLLFFLGYSLPMVFVGMSGMFICYLLLDVLYFFVAYCGADKSFQKELSNIRWIIFALPFYRYLIYWFRLAGNIQVLTEPKSWKVQNPIQQLVDVFEGYKKKLWNRWLKKVGGE